MVNNDPRDQYSSLEIKDITINALYAQVRTNSLSPVVSFRNIPLDILNQIAEIKIGTVHAQSGPTNPATSVDY
jgi:hypothetical protein